MFIYSDSSSGNNFFFVQIVCIIESYQINADVEKISLKNPRSLITNTVFWICFVNLVKIVDVIE